MLKQSCTLSQKNRFEEGSLKKMLFSLLCFMQKKICIALPSSVKGNSERCWGVCERTLPGYPGELKYGDLTSSLEIQPDLRKKVGDRYILEKHLKRFFSPPHLDHASSRNPIWLCEDVQGIHPLRTGAPKTKWKGLLKMGSHYDRLTNLICVAGVIAWVFYSPSQGGQML